MKMKLFFAAVAVCFTLGVVTSCGNKKADANAEETTASVQVSDSVYACCAQKADSVACCDSVSECCKEKAEATAE